MTRFDIAIVGSGILGLAHAYHAARAGKRVVVIERSPKAVGASVRNFGMLWPIGQPAGGRRTLALRSREHWLTVLADAGLWHERTGSLHLAYADDEAAVLQEFAAGESQTRFLSPEETREKAPAVRREHLRGALWSPTETCVDPRAVIAALPGYLADRFGVAFRFGTAVQAIERPVLVTSDGTIEAEAVIVCAGVELQALYADALAADGLFACKLQMLRTAPVEGGWRVGPMLAAGLTLRHYASFAHCPSLPALKARLIAELPDYERFGIHVMVSQNGAGELVLGDSHEYGADAFSPFSSETIDGLILDYLATFFAPPALRIASRWQGVYCKHPTEPYRVLSPEAGVTLVTGVGGAGMTLSFGLAERVVERILG
jgi:FAD dependent oxidoreductase TIGR03364